MEYQEGQNDTEAVLRNGTNNLDVDPWMMINFKVIA